MPIVGLKPLKAKSGGTNGAQNERPIEHDAACFIGQLLANIPKRFAVSGKPLVGEWLASQRGGFPEPESRKPIPVEASFVYGERLRYLSD